MFKVGDKVKIILLNWENPSQEKQEYYIGEIGTIVNVIGIIYEVDIPLFSDRHCSSTFWKEYELELV